MSRPTVDQASKQHVGDSEFVNLVVLMTWARWKLTGHFAFERVGRNTYLCRLFFFSILFVDHIAKLTLWSLLVDCVYWQKVNISTTTTYWISSRSLENYILSFDGFFMWHEVVSFIRIADKRLQKDLHYYCLPPFINLWLIECIFFSFNPWNSLNYLLNYKNPILRRLESVYNQYGKL